MKRRVYRSLDRPATVFGIRGRFLWVMALGGALAFIIGMVVGGVSSMIMGFGASLLAAVGAYLVTMSLQSKINEKDIWKLLVKRGYPRVYRVPPKHIRNIWKGFNLRPAGPTEKH